MNTTQDFEDLLKDAAHETGADLGDSVHAVSLYASERAAHLATIVNQPGFDRALRAERDSVALKAGLSVAQDAAGVDQRIVGIIQGALGMLAKALAAV